MMHEMEKPIECGNIKDQAEQCQAKKLAWNELFLRALVEKKNTVAEMQSEIDKIQAAADSKIQAVKERYAQNHGRASWNSTTEQVFRDLSQSIDEHDKPWNSTTQKVLRALDKQNR